MPTFADARGVIHRVPLIVKKTQAYKPAAVGQLQPSQLTRTRPRGMCKKDLALMQSMLARTPAMEKQIVWDEIRENFSKYNTVLLFKLDTPNQRQFMDFRIALKSSTDKIKVFRNSLIRKCLEDTPDKHMSDLISGQCVYVFADTPNLPAVLKTIKKHKKFELAYARIDNRLYTLQGVQSYAKLPTLDQLLSETSALLAAPASKLLTNLRTNQETLTKLLAQHATVAEGTEGESEQ